VTSTCTVLRRCARPSLLSKCSIVGDPMIITGHELEEGRGVLIQEKGRERERSEERGVVREVS